eukprot:2182092-Pleurochrysis_carterae.AAC.1
MAAIVALVAEDAALASIARVPSSSLPLPFAEMAYERRAAGHRLASSGVRAGNAETEAAVAGAAEPAVDAAACACERGFSATASRECGQPAIGNGSAGHGLDCRQLRFPAT